MDHNEETFEMISSIRIIRITIPPCQLIMRRRIYLRVTFILVRFYVSELPFCSW